MSAGDLPASAIAALPSPPFYAVIFTNIRTAGDNGYAQTAARMQELAAKQPGYLGFESAHNQDGFGVAVSYWRDLSAIENWKNQAEHLRAQENGRQRWYADYAVRVAKVERCYAKPPRV